MLIQNMECRNEFFYLSIDFSKCQIEPIYFSWLLFFSWNVLVDLNRFNLSFVFQLKIWWN